MRNALTTWRFAAARASGSGQGILPVHIGAGSAISPNTLGGAVVSANTDSMLSMNLPLNMFGKSCKDDSECEHTAVLYHVVNR